MRVLEIERDKVESEEKTHGDGEREKWRSGDKSGDVDSSSTLSCINDITMHCEFMQRSAAYLAKSHGALIQPSNNPVLPRS